MRTGDGTRSSDGVRRVRVGFIMDQVAGHVTGYRNLRRIVEQDDEIEPMWGEIHYQRPDGWIERAHRLVPFVPDHPFGAVRGLVEQGRALRRGPFDVIMTNTTTAYLTSPWLRRVPTLFDFDSTPHQREQMGYYASPSAFAPVAAGKRRLALALYRSAALNQAWTTWAQRSVIDDYGIEPARVAVNPPGIDLSLWSPVDRASRESGPARVLFVGTDFERKGGADLLAWHRTLEPGRVELDVVSNGHVPAEPGVAVHRGLSANAAELRALYGRADVFVLPSRAECFGIATIEAMAAGLPVVVSDIGGTADIVDHGDNGLIVPARDVRALGDAIATILDDPGRRVSMGVRSRQLAERRFDLRRNAQVTIDRLKQLARSTGPGQAAARPAEAGR
jgi:glycosyltransferase involved in cell wall biosynthesis